MHILLKKRGAESRKAQSRGGFTLAEIMVALVIFGFVMTGLVKFSLQTSQILFDSTKRMELDADIRKFSQLFTNDAKTADAFYMYNSFVAGDRNETDGSDRLGQEESGDFVLFVYTEPQPYTTSTVYITKLVGYFRRYDTSEGDTGRGDVYRFEIDYDDQTEDASSVTVESLLTSYGYNDDYPKVLSNALGTYDDHMFMNHLSKCIMVGAEIYRGNDVRSTTQLINLTVAP